MAIYAPILASSMPAFTPENYTISFSLSNFTNVNDVAGICVRIVYQNNNQSILKGSSAQIDGLYYQDCQLVSGANSYPITVPSSAFTNGGWDTNCYYKIQVRLYSYPLNTDTDGSAITFAAWKQLNDNFSEWSTVMVAKVINAPTIQILNNAANLDTDLIIDSLNNQETTSTPTFYGQFTCDGEVEQSYKFDLYNKNDVLLESSGWLTHYATNDNTQDSHRFQLNLETADVMSYYVLYSARTTNEYESTAQPYTFVVKENNLTKSNINLISFDAVINEMDNDTPQENARFIIQLSQAKDESNAVGNYVISRSSEDSNFTIWEDIKYLKFSGSLTQVIPKNTFIDYTIETGKSYAYRIQYENSAGLRSPAKYEGNLTTPTAHMMYFKDTYLYANDVQLRLKYNFSMSSYKHVVLEGKQDTLGGKYPLIMRNGQAYYREMSVSGLIAYDSDIEHTFFTLGDDGLYYQGDKILDSSLFDSDEYVVNQNLSDKNIYIEKIFRDKVEEFLNNGEYKVFKSPTEGNMIVALTGVSLTPKTELGRLLYEFSATVDEVLEYTLDNLDEYNLIDIGEFSTKLSDTNEIVTGQLAGYYIGKYTRNSDGTKSTNATYDDLYQAVLDAEQTAIGESGDYKYKMDTVSAIWIENYPDTDLSPQLSAVSVEIRQIQQEIEEATTEERIDELTKELEDKQEEYNNLSTLQTSIENNPVKPIITIYVNDKPVLIGLNQVYYLTGQDITSLYLQTSAPIIINYTCEKYQVENYANTEQSVALTSPWGQLYGVFTTPTSSALWNYDISTDITTLAVSGYNYNVYRSLDIMAIIQEKALEQISEAYGLTFTRYYDNKNYKYIGSDNQTYYNFNNLSRLSIEAQPGTVIVRTFANGTTNESVVGPTGVYIEDALTTDLTGVKFKYPTFALINYKCSTTQTKMKEAII